MSANEFSKKQVQALEKKMKTGYHNIMRARYFGMMKGLLQNGAFWRIILVISLIYYLPETGVRFFPVADTAAAQTNVLEQPELDLGMGGGLFLEEAAFQAEMDFMDIPGLVDYSGPRMLTYSFLTMGNGDIIGHIAARAGLNEDTLLSVNDIRNTRRMQIGQVIRIPNQDGIYYTVRTGDTLDSIAETYRTTISHIKVANQLFSETLTPNTRLFIPGGRMDWISRQEVNGDLFIWPTIGRLTSPFGFRRSPFTGARQFHGGIDIAAPTGTPVRAAMSGRVARIGFNNVLGNYIVLNHHSGFRTLYAHLHVVRVRPGANVATGERIGDVGNTGLSTGPHLHFEVHRDGVRVNPRTLMR